MTTSGRSEGQEMNDRTNAAENKAAPTAGPVAIFQARQHSDEEARWEDVYEATYSACASQPQFYATRIVYADPQPTAQADTQGEDAYVAKRLSEALADVYTTLIGDDAVDTDDGMNAIERVARVAQVIRIEVELYRAHAEAQGPHTSEPTAWFEAEEAARDVPLRALLTSMAYSTRWHMQSARPETSNPVWPIHTVPLVPAQIDTRRVPPVESAWCGGAASLARFAGYVLKDHRNDGYPGDVDGDSLQGYAVRCGLIEERSVDAPCSEGCSCADVGVFPTVCYFNTDLGKTAIAAAHAEVQGGANASS
ncbi:hypothetical protein [Burkholderia arboris]|uniref:hypothetical protein n=1 Tax=Burkholderia arboris TaxID=488730 RepID=UPI001CF22339|nr:hypothetical protein [Burkholderia arboris]